MLDCGHDSTDHGYSDGRTLCYACMYAKQLEEMRCTTRLFAYHGAGDLVTDWPGNKLGVITKSKITKVGTMSQLRVWVTDVHGQRWYGTGPTENGNYLRLRKTRQV